MAEPPHGAWRGGRRRPRGFDGRRGFVARGAAGHDRAGHHPAPRRSGRPAPAVARARAARHRPDRRGAGPSRSAHGAPRRRRGRPRPGARRAGMTDQLAGSYVVGTAGHIDHGKSALVLALTQIDPDRLEEEKRRGMTIDLGFAYMQLPSGRRVGIVDVPGHQRFLKNMLAGVHGMDAVLLVIAADEGPMPQTREHLAIIDLLGIEHGLVVLTKADLVDDAWLGLVREDVTNLLAGTSLQNAPIVAVSSTTGAGLDQLRAALDEELAKTAARPDLGRPRLPIDRSFAISGFGTVVTGTLVGGGLLPRAAPAHLAAGRRVRIRGLQQDNRPVEEARPGSRTAVNLSGLDHSEVRRGDVLALPGTLPASRRLDARLVVLPGVQPLRHHQQLQMYHETSEVMIELSLLERDELRGA